MDEDRKSGPGRGSDDLSRLGADAGTSLESLELPRSLRRRLDRCADDFIEQCGADLRDTPVARWPVRQLVYSWSVSALLLVVAIAGWWPRLVEAPTALLDAGTGQWGARMARENMLESGHGIGHWPWRGDAAAGTGDVVWDNERQQGFLMLRGLAANDPSRSRYQLWIFDAARDDRYPVDGGLFDVPAGQDAVVVPVSPALRISRPVAFAVTVEQPGGAVVSEREQIVAFAPADR